MKHLFRMAAFRALAPNEGSGGGGPSSDAASASLDVGAYFGTQASDAAYKAATGEDAPAADQDDEPKPVADAEDDQEPEKPEEKEAEEPEKEETPEEKNEPAKDPEAEREELLAKHPDFGLYLEFEQDLLNPARAGERLREFTENLARHHNTTVAEMLGLPNVPIAPEAPKRGEEEEWRLRGFDSKDDYDRAADFEKAGYDSPGELRLAQELAAIKAALKPLEEQQAKVAKEAKDAREKSEWEKGIASLTPTALKAVEQETGFKATEAQALQAALDLPELSSRPGGLAKAIIATNMRTILAQARPTAEKKEPPEMPNGQRRQGASIPDPMDDWEGFSKAIAEKY